MMAFSSKQYRALKRQADQRHVRVRKSGGRELSYIEGWYAIAEANRIFGFEAWDRETLESKCVFARETRGVLHAVYISRVRVTVRSDGCTTVREAHGTGEGRGGTIGEAHEFAIKQSETDATKRALCTFGKAFGLALYGSGRPSVLERGQGPASDSDGNNNIPTSLVRPSPPGQTRESFGKLTHIHRFEERYDGPELESDRDVRGHPSSPNGSGHIDKNTLILAPAVRRRDRAHLKFVALQNCLVCGRSPCDPHHLTFSQPKALGRKVSDEFTVPLCRIHHRALHRYGGEVSWWQRVGIDPLPIATQLWESSHSRLEKTGS